jgi:hypothetical protein
MAPQELPLPGTRPTERDETVDTNILRKAYPEGSPFTSEETPHGCYDGWVYIGYEGKDENGKHVEVIERVPRRRCNTANATL